MNVTFLLKQYFADVNDVTIDVFDAHNLNDVYQQVLQTLTSHFEIEVSVLQSLSYCFYEILDNVHIHSGNHKLIYKDGKTEVIENGLWQGTIVYMEVCTSKDIDLTDLKEHMTFCNPNPTAERSILVAQQRRTLTN